MAYYSDDKGKYVKHVTMHLLQIMVQLVPSPPSSRRRHCQWGRGGSSGGGESHPIIVVDPHCSSCMVVLSPIDDGPLPLTHRCLLPLYHCLTPCRHHRRTRLWWFSDNTPEHHCQGRGVPYPPSFLWRSHSHCLLCQQGNHRRWRVITEPLVCVSSHQNQNTGHSHHCCRRRHASMVWGGSGREGCWTAHCLATQLSSASVASGLLVLSTGRCSCCSGWNEPWCWLGGAVAVGTAVEWWFAVCRRRQRQQRRWHWVCERWVKRWVMSLVSS